VVQAKQRTFAKKEVVVGIDLGTTNSAVAYIKKGKPVCIPNSDGDNTTPSVVTILPEGEVLVGKKARKQATASPDTTYYSVKRLIGGRL
jgi:molecular chaperone DnaK (HSP70)